MTFTSRLRRLAVGTVALAGVLLSAVASEPVPAPALTTLRVFAHPAVPDLQCTSAPRSASPAAVVDADPREVPDDEDIQAALKATTGTSARPVPVAPWGAGLLGHARPGEPYRVGIWGDSHLAAGFFTQALVKRLQLAPEQVRAGFIPASMNRPGVRLPLRKSCVSPQWRYESAHASTAAAATPGPGLVSLSSAQAGATLAWDLRNAAGAPEARQLRVLYQQTANPVRLAVSVDGDQEVEVVLSGAPGPAALELAADGPLSVVQLRLVSGELRLQGLALPVPQQTAVQMDVFAYPGATVAGWKQAALDPLKAWFAQTRYDLVMLEFGTNEGNVKPFDASVYQTSLRESVQRMRSVFPDAACVLIAPGDRGVLVRRSEKSRRVSPGVQSVTDKKVTKGATKGKSKGKAPTSAHASAQSKPKSLEARASKVKPGKQRKAAAPATDAARAMPLDHAVETNSGATRRDLLQYSHIHEEIGQIQRNVAQEQGCSAWSMQDAMGGPGSAYTWVRREPALMARDLIHFTVPGYQQLADQFANDMGWEASQILSVTPP